MGTGVMRALNEIRGKTLYRIAGTRLAISVDGK